MAPGKQGARVRAAAATAIDAVVRAGRSLDDSLADAEARVAERDLPLLRLLCYGTIRHHYRLHAWLGQLLDRPFKARDSVVESLIAVGLYQLTETRVPDHAVVSQTVEATRLLRRPKLAGVVNAVLRRFMREGLADQPSDAEEARWDHPRWLIDRLREDWPDDWQDILAANNERAPMWLRVNTARSTPAELLARLHDADIAATAMPGLDAAIRLESPVPVAELPGFAEGDVSVQDGGAQLAAPWLLAGCNGPILDACAAPGGKSAHLLELGGADIALTCIEKDKKRAVAIDENLERLGLAATVTVADASNPDSWWSGKRFNGILLDAPCSATGVIRRHPDIKLLRRPSDLESLSELQGLLLGTLWELLEPGGRLLYVTCSVLAAENEAIVGRLLETAPDVRENDVLQNNNIRDLMRRKACGYQLLPGTAGMDGFYFACLEKVA